MFLHSLDTFDVAALSSKITLYFHVLSDGNNNAASYIKTCEKIRVNIRESRRNIAADSSILVPWLPTDSTSDDQSEPCGAMEGNGGDKGLKAEVQREY